MLLIVINKQLQFVNMKNTLSFFFLLNYIFLNAQEEINATVVIDENSNLKVTQLFNEITREHYLFQKDITLNQKEVLFIKDKGPSKEYKTLDVKQVNFKVITDKSTINDDFFISDAKYVGIKTSDFYYLKKFNIDFSSDKYKIIFPSQEDLKEKYTVSPKIVAGNFNFFEDNGFKVYYLESEKEYLEEMKKANLGMHKSFEFYSKYFGEKRKPKIVFAPTKEASVTNENIIVYNSDIIKRKNRENSISHEIAHIWFGHDGIIFERPLVEGVAEFLSKLYIVSQYGEKSLNVSIGERFYQLEGEKSLENFRKSGLNKNETFLLSYRLLPMYFYCRQQQDSTFIYSLAKLYKNKESERKTNLDEINVFFKSINVESINTEELFPDFFVLQKDANEVYLTSNSDKEYEVEIEFTSINDEKSVKKISFSKNQKQHKIEIDDLKKIVIDPEFKILQLSRLNDVWNKNDNNVFNKNRYINISTKIGIDFISNEIADFLSGKTQNISDKITINSQVEKELKKLRTVYSKQALTGGVASLVKKNNSLYLFFSFYDEKAKESTVLKTIFKLNDDKTEILALKNNDDSFSEP